MLSRLHLWLPLAAALLVTGCGSSAPTDDVELVASEPSVLSGRHPVLFVSRNCEDGQWIMLTDERARGDVVVFARFADLLGLDSTLARVKDLPAGWKAWRETKGAPWVREPLATRGEP